MFSNWHISWRSRVWEIKRGVPHLAATHFDVSRILETSKFPLSPSPWDLNALNKAKRLNGWNDWNGYFAQREGAMRLGTKEYRQFVGIARGSAGEVCYQLLLARDLNYISNETYQELRSGYDRVIQMLSRLSQSLGNEPRTRSR
jgi:hypothetical protein